MFNIEKGVVLPSRSQYPFANMAVGDSFVVPESYPNSDAVRIRAYQFGKRHQMTFSSRKEAGGIRVWRTA